MNVVKPKELGLLFDKCNVAHLKLARQRETTTAASLH